jgi:hypothetical protein
VHPLDVVTFVVFAVLLGAGLFIAFWLGELPGRIAAWRGHPNADAVRVAGWLGILTLGIFWPLALIWAFTGLPGHAARGDLALRAEVADLSERIRVLEEKSGEGAIGPSS